MNDIRDDLKAFLDGELSPERAAEVQAALNNDPALQQEAETMKLLGFEIKRLAAEPMVSGRAETLAALRGPAKKKWSPARWAMTAGAATIAVFVIGASLFPNLARSGFPAQAENDAAMAPAAMPDEMMKQSAPMAGADAPADEAVPGRAMPESAPPTSSVAPNATLPPDLSNRMVIKNGSLGVRVESVNDAMNDATNIASGLGGFVTNSNRAGTDSGGASGSMTLRVPSKQFETAIKRLGALGEVVDGPNLSGDDVTAQHADLTARIKVLKAEEDSLIMMLRAARRVNEMLEIKERITRVRSEIDSMAAQAKSLKDLSAMSTISVTFEQKPKIGQAEKPADPLGEAWVNAVNGLRSAGTFLGQVAINLFVYAPIWLPIALILGVWVRRAWRAS